MFKGRTVAVVIPAYDEANHIAGVVNSIPAFVDRVYAIDDGSEDDTWTVLADCAHRLNADDRLDSQTPFDRRVVPIRHDHNRGAGAAVITGYKRALDDDVDVIAVMDGDGQMNPGALERIITPVVTDTVAYAKGNRLHSRSDRAAMSRWRLFGNSLLTLLTRVSSGYWQMSDPQNGFTAISRDALTRLPLERLYTNYGFLNDVLVHLNVNRERIADIAHEAQYGDEISGIRYHTFVPSLSSLLLKRYVQRIWTNYAVRSFHPMVLCLLGGVPLAAAGVVGIAYAIVTPTIATFVGAMSALTVLSIGWLMITLACWFDARENEQLVARHDRDRVAPPYPPIQRAPLPADERVAALGDGGNLDEPDNPDQSQAYR